ncbi:MAG: flavin reductase [Acidimicrobiaceae bacterium]|nr:flavin reductase [Acidimicrobiaceae bacterium]
MVGSENTVVGPIPAGHDPDRYDRSRRRVLWLMPSGLYLLGSTAGGRRNLMTLNWATQVATDPKLLLVSVERGALTHQLITEGGVFALSILSRDDRPVVRKFAKPATEDGSTLSGFPVQQAPSGAPVLAQAVAWLDCRVHASWELGSHTAFVGEVVDCGGLDDGAGEETPEILRMEDTRMSYGG